MTLWFVLALMAVAASFAVLWPLGRRAAVRTGGEEAVYQDQLDEIDRDRAAGLIADREAEAARVEVARRLIAAADREQPTTASESEVRRRWVAVVAIVLLPAFAIGVYSVTGSPHLPDQPIASREEPVAGQSSVTDLVARVESHLEANPQDGRGWEVLAPVYMRMNRYEDAVRARRNALELLGPTAVREADLGEAMAGAANGVVTADAKSAFERSLALDPSEIKARFFLGIAAEQDGNPAEAAQRWRAMLAEAPIDAPWVGVVTEALRRVDPTGAAAATPRPAPSPGPSADDVAAASTLSPEQRTDMVRGMVERLATRLKTESDDVDGWSRLLRAYMVLGERERADAAVADARRALGSDAAKLEQINALAKTLGLGG